MMGKNCVTPNEWDGVFAHRNMGYLHSMPTTGRGEHDSPVERVKADNPIFVRRVRVPAHPCPHPRLIREIRIHSGKMPTDFLERCPGHGGLKLPGFVVLLIGLG